MCEMKITDLPWATSERMTSKRPSTSWGVSTAVGLIEDQDIGVAIQQLDDLNPLLNARPEVFDDRVRVHIESIAIRYLADAAGGDLAVQESESGASIPTQHHVFGDREDLGPT